MPSVILNYSLQQDVIAQKLSEKYNIRISNSTIKDSIIFSSGVIFLIMKLQIIEQKEAIERFITSRCMKMAKNHKNCYLFLKIDTQVSMSDNFSKLSYIQDHIINTSIKLLPIKIDTEIVTAMEEITRLHQKVHSSEIFVKLSSFLQKKTPSRNYLITDALSKFGFEEHEQYVLIDNFGSLDAICNASVDKILDGTNNVMLANKLKLFSSRFNSDANIENSINQENSLESEE